MKPIKLLDDRVLVRQDDEEKATASGIILGSEAEEQYTGVVVAIGTGRPTPHGHREPMTVKVGDRVIFGKYARLNRMDDLGEELLMMKEVEIYGIVED